MNALLPELELAPIIGGSSDGWRAWRLVDAADVEPSRLKHTVAIRTEA